MVEKETAEMVKFWLLLFGSFLLRLLLIFYGEWQDSVMQVKYTDVDYFVFQDAANFSVQGKSPYLRATYRYTPLLAWMLQPNILWNSVFGKLLFISFDVLTGFLIFCLLRNTNTVSQRQCIVASCLWLFNPLPMTVSSRGNAESIMTALIIFCLLMLQKGRVLLAGCIYSLSIHFKIYPVVYALPIYFYLGDGTLITKFIRTSDTAYRTNLMRKILPNKNQTVFILSAGFTLAVFTGYYYYRYGWDFLYHTYLYHIVRKDIRHNFSIYFYMLYLTTGLNNSVILGLLCFLPQFLLLVVFSFKFYRDPPLAFFLNTFAFVMLNKVCTSQYFLWYLGLLPVIYPNLHISFRKAVVVLVLWFVGQGIWLFPAYLLEFDGQNTFLFIWLAGIVFFLINIYILLTVIAAVSHTSHPCWSHTPAHNDQLSTSLCQKKSLKKIKMT
ncbi:hypothetical protein CHS0354_003549 [Potamilus streckersoni]|uniref:GPI alpha-1,4-mannosyltransferase I, catalytic subunit n=1 Tax=Potamilus streckersoni TaxID=2493646 RepID=A0AAE0RVD3_9BIVA|nr:hypothetical protein CHS0354_003549 [Potamilus streckersoni]